MKQRVLAHFRLHKIGELIWFSLTGAGGLFVEFVERQGLEVHDVPYVEGRDPVISVFEAEGTAGADLKLALCLQT